MRTCLYAFKMKQSNKRLRVTKESTITDIATSIVDISETLNSIGKTHRVLLKTNEVLVKYLLAVEEDKIKLNYSKFDNPSQAPPPNPSESVTGSEVTK